MKITMTGNLFKVVLLCAVMPWAALAGLKEKIQEEIDSNPFLKEQGIKIVVQKEENGYITLDMAAGNPDIRKAHRRWC